MRFKTKIDLLESMGSEFYAYFDVEAEQVAPRSSPSSRPTPGRPTWAAATTQIVARLDAASRSSRAQETELIFESDKLHLFDPESGDAPAQAQQRR